jgi:nucleoside-diphosphate-sugar epimerase
MERALITGLNGFTGSHLARLLHDQGYEVHGLVHAKCNILGPDLATTHLCDINDESALRRVLAEVRPAYVVHLAAISFVAHGDIEEMYRVNVLGTRALLEGCVSLALDPRAILVASSANVYGNSDAGILDEATPIQPANDYGVTKAAVEHIARLYMDRLPITIVRPFNYTGVGQSLSFLVPKIVDHVRRRAEKIELGNLDVARDISDVRSVVQLYARILKMPELVGETFNVCSGRAVTLGEILDLAMAIGDHRMEVFVNPAFVRANEVKTLCGSAKRLEAMIGPLDIPPIEQTLRWMIEA